MSPERDLQEVIVTLLRLNFPPGGDVWWTAINPVPAKSRAVAGLSKAMGLRAGVPDLLIVHDGRPLFIELKAPGRSLSAHQFDLHADLTRAGARVATVRSVKELAGLLAVCGIPMRARVTA